MDPNANLAEQRRLVARIIAATDDIDRISETEIAHDADRLAALVDALDEWICKGGFLPHAWRRP